ncbi:MAG: DUF4838 domain-containing protein, partial [Lentisphaeria bacterium]|nr:DUF4838 domain-containing protein [Lentisphaeria bacterium]
SPLEGDKSGEYITFCVSNPALHKLIVQEWLNSPDRSEDNIPYRPFLNACENDTPGMCTCSQCRCWDAPDDRFDSSDYWSGKITPHRSRRFPLLARASWGEDGGQPLSTPPSLSDRYVHFYNALLAEARKYDPAAKVFGYAYSNYHEPPRQTRLNPGVIISNVPQLWFPYTDEMSKKFRSDWIGWFQAGAQQMVLRPNLTHAGANLPIYYAERFAADFSFAAKNGMCATYFDSLLGSWSAQGPTLYVLTRIHEHPEWTAEQILEEYYSGFGSASDAVKSYFAVWKQFSDNLSAAEVKRIELAERDPVTGNPGGGFKNYTGIAHHLFPLSLFDQAREKLEYAWQAAKGDSQTENRIRFLMLGCTDAELTVKTRIAQKQYQSDKTPENKQVFQQAFEELSQHRALAEPYNVANFGYIAARERESLQWPWKTK